MSEVHPLDQSIVLRGTDVDLFDVVDQIVTNSVDNNDPRLAFNAAAMLRKWGQVSGLALAKMLYQIKARWESFDTDEDFVDMAAAETGLSTQTVFKYTAVWEHVILGCPPHLRDRFMAMPMETLWLMAPASKDGDLDESWEKLSLAPDKKTVRDTVREIRGEVTSSTNALVILLERDGTLRAKRGQDDFEDFGFLNLKKDSPTVQAAIDKLLGVGVVIR